MLMTLQKKKVRTKQQIQYYYRIQNQHTKTSWHFYTFTIKYLRKKTILFIILSKKVNKFNKELKDLYTPYTEN